MEKCAEHQRCLKDIETLQRDVKENTKKTEATYDAVFGRNGHIGLSARVGIHGDRLDTIDTQKRDVTECNRTRGLDRNEVNKMVDQLTAETEAKFDSIKRSLDRREDRRFSGKHLLIAILVPNTITVALGVVGLLLR